MSSSGLGDRWDVRGWGAGERRMERRRWQRDLHVEQASSEDNTARWHDHSILQSQLEEQERMWAERSRAATDELAQSERATAMWRQRAECAMRERQATLLNNELIEATGRHMKMELMEHEEATPELLEQLRVAILDVSVEQAECKRFCDECDELRTNLRVAEAAGLAHGEWEAQARTGVVEMFAVFKRQRVSKEDEDEEEEGDEEEQDQ